jgi:hypothetical protein
MSRIEKLNQLRSHPMIGKDFKRISKEALEEVEAFILARENMSDDEFMHDANRFKLGQEKGKFHTIQWSLLIQTVDTTKNLKRRQ